MQRSFPHQASAFALALLMTLTLAAGIQGLAASPAPADLMAQQHSTGAQS